VVVAHAESSFCWRSRLELVHHFLAAALAPRCKGSDHGPSLRCPCDCPYGECRDATAGLKRNSCGLRRAEKNGGSSRPDNATEEITALLKGDTVVSTRSFREKSIARGTPPICDAGWCFVSANGHFGYVPEGTYKSARTLIGKGAF
jgi:hypothetical protein